MTFQLFLTNDASRDLEELVDDIESHDLKYVNEE
jgi:plasmid stabilization system protein ParE